MLLKSSSKQRIPCCSKRSWMRSTMQRQQPSRSVKLKKLLVRQQKNSAARLLRLQRQRRRRQKRLMKCLRRTITRKSWPDSPSLPINRWRISLVFAFPVLAEASIRRTTLLFWFLRSEKPVATSCIMTNGLQMVTICILAKVKPAIRP